MCLLYNLIRLKCIFCCLYELIVLAKRQHRKKCQNYDHCYCNTANDSYHLRVDLRIDLHLRSCCDRTACLRIESLWTLSLIIYWHPCIRVESLWTLSLIIYLTSGIRVESLWTLSLIIYRHSCIRVESL